VGVKHLLPLLLLAVAARAEDDRPERRVADGELQTEINRAIERGVAYLKFAEKRDGSWSYDGTLPGPVREEAAEEATGGLTALALYALAASCVPSEDPAISRGLAWVKAHKEPFAADASYATYSASLLTLALTRIDSKRHRKQIEALAGRIAEGLLPGDLWTYRLDIAETAERREGPRRPPPRGDHSNSQFAVLALWAAQAIAGCEVPRATWQRIRNHFSRTQLGSGRWSYNPGIGGGPGGQESTNMTAAGLVSLVSAEAALMGGVDALPMARTVPEAIRGLDVFLRGPRNYADYYFVYSLERVGTVLGVPDDPWYPPVARELIRVQTEEGRWPVRGNGAGPQHGDGKQVYETSFALLFLSRATAYATTPKGIDLPDLADPARLAKAFELYLAMPEARRRQVAVEFRRAGDDGVVFLEAKRRAAEPRTSAAAAEILEAIRGS